MKTFKLIAPVVAILAAMLVTAPAHAATIEPSKSADAGVSLIQGREITDPNVANNLIAAYWTPQRMRQAIPVTDPQSIVDDVLEAADRPGNVGPEETAAFPTTAPPPPPGATSTRTSLSAQSLLDVQTSASTQGVSASPGVGKVFFTNAKDGKDYVCSGSTINNPALNLVDTAGHCVHGGKNGTWHQNWAYVPYYDHGAAPYGTWAAKWFTSVKGWTKHSYSWWDFGFVNVWPKSGTKLVSTTGGNGLKFNYSKWIDVTVLAYPSAAPFDGQWQIFCKNNLYPHGTQQVGFNCLMTKGSSGGPFLYHYDNDIRFGLVASHIAHGPDDKSYGPYYDNDVKDIYNIAKNKV